MQQHAERDATYTQLYNLQTSQLVLLVKRVNVKVPINATKSDYVAAIMRGLGYGVPKPHAGKPRVNAAPKPPPKKEVTQDDIARLFELVRDEATLLRNTADALEGIAAIMQSNPRNVAQQVTSEVRYAHNHSNLAAIVKLEAALDPNNPYRS